jgi:hypothetical protein
MGHNVTHGRVLTSRSVPEISEILASVELPVRTVIITESKESLAGSHHTLGRGCVWGRVDDGAGVRVFAWHVPCLNSVRASRDARTSHQPDGR